MKKEIKKVEMLEEKIRDAIHQPMFNTASYFEQVNGVSPNFKVVLLGEKSHRAEYFFEKEEDARLLFELLAGNLNSDNYSVSLCTTHDSLIREVDCDSNNEYLGNKVIFDSRVEKLMLIGYINTKYKRVHLLPRSICAMGYPQPCQLRALLDDFEKFTNSFESCAKAKLYELEGINSKSCSLAIIYKRHLQEPTWIYIDTFEHACEMRALLKNHEAVANVLLIEHIQFNK